MREPRKGEVVEETQEQEGTQAEPEQEPGDELPSQGLGAENIDDDALEEPLEEDAEEEVEEPEPPEQWPSLEEYQRKWDRLFNEHGAVNPGAFSRDNLVPEPIPQLWQDCPYVPSVALMSDEAQARLSRCRPISGLQTARIEDGINHYAHNSAATKRKRTFQNALKTQYGST